MPSSRFHRFALPVSLSCWLVANAMVTTTHAQILEPELRSLSVTGGRVGTTIEIAAVGERLEETVRLQFSHPGIQTTSKAESGDFVVSIGSDVPPGRYDARVVGSNGVSNPQAFLVSELENERPAATSHQSAEPTQLRPNVLTHGVSVAAQVDYYSLTLLTGGPLRIDLFAARLDSRMIGQIRLYDAKGHELARVRGSDDHDPTIELDAVPAGDYIIAVNDFLYRGGDEYRYQIVARENASAAFLFESRWRGPEAVSVSEGTIFDDPPRRASEVESIDIPHDATWSVPPGRSPRVFEFDANQGDALTIDLVSHRLGEPTDLRLKVQRVETDASGNNSLHEVLSADDSQEITDGLLRLASRDPVASFVAPATAMYRIAVRDLDVGESLKPNQRFRMQVRTSTPSFDLVAYRVYPHNDIAQSRPHGSRLFRGGSEAIRVLAVRRDGWAGAIELGVENLPAGVHSSPVTMAANQTQAQLIITTDEDAAASVAAIRIVGRSVDGKNEITAKPAAILTTKGGNRDFISMRLADELMIAITEKLAPISIQLGSDAAELVTIKAGEPLTVPVTLTRRDGGKEAVTVRPRDLPPTVTASEIVIAADAAQGNLVFATTPATPVGTYSLWTLSETNIKLTPDAAALTAFLPSSSITFRVTEP